MQILKIENTEKDWYFVIESDGIVRFKREGKEKVIEVNTQMKLLKSLDEMVLHWKALAEGKMTMSGKGGAKIGYENES